MCEREREKKRKLLREERHITDGVSVNRNYDRSALIKLANWSNTTTPTRYFCNHKLSSKFDCTKRLFGNNCMLHHLYLYAILVMENWLCRYSMKAHNRWSFFRFCAVHTSKFAYEQLIHSLQLDGVYFKYEITINGYAWIFIWI